MWIEGRQLLEHFSFNFRREDATPDIIHWAPALPKTRSGKIMRRILRKIAEDKIDEIGDTTTLADPRVVARLKDEYESLET